MSRSAERNAPTAIIVPQVMKDCVAKFLNGTPTKEKFALFNAIAKGDTARAKQIFQNVLDHPGANMCVSGKIRTKMEKWLKDHGFKRAA